MYSNLSQSLIYHIFLVFKACFLLEKFKIRKQNDDLHKILNIDRNNTP